MLPSTTATPSMLAYMVNKGVAERYSDPFIAARERVQLEMEGVGGCRIGEVAGGGDVHTFTFPTAKCCFRERPMRPFSRSITMGFNKAPSS